VVTRGWLPQRAGLPGLNGSGDATTVPSTQDGERKRDKGMERAEQKRTG